MMGLYGAIIGANAPINIIDNATNPQKECHGLLVTNVLTGPTIVDKILRVCNPVFSGSELWKECPILTLCAPSYEIRIRGSKTLYKISIHKLTRTNIIP